MSEFSNLKSHPHHQHSHISSSSVSNSNCCSNDGETACCYENRCGHFFNNYRGPLIVIAIGIGFMVVGAIPVSIAAATKTKNSALIIGAGFIGFGLIIFLPGVVWCVVQRLLNCACCSSHCNCCISPPQQPLRDDDFEGDDDTSRTEEHSNIISIDTKPPTSYKYIPQNTLLNHMEGECGAVFAGRLNDNKEDDINCYISIEGEKEETHADNNFNNLTSSSNSLKPIFNNNTTSNNNANDVANNNIANINNNIANINNNIANINNNIATNNIITNNNDNNTNNNITNNNDKSKIIV